MTARANWDGHEFDPNGMLQKVVDKRRAVQAQLAEQIVGDIENKFEEICDSKTTGYNRATFIEGSLHDFATEAAALVVEALGRCPSTYVDFNELAQQIRDVPALKAV